MGLAKQSAQMFAAKAALSVLLMATAIVNNRVLGPAGKGQCVIALLVVATLSIVAPMGMGTAFQYYINKRRERAGAFVGLSLIVAFGMGAVLGVPIWIFRAPLQATILKHVPDSTLLLALASVPFEILRGNLLGSILLARLKVMQFSALWLIQGATVLILAVVLVYWLRLGVNGAVAGYGLSLVIPALVALYWVIRSEGISFDFRGGLIRQTAGYSWKSFLSQVAMKLQYRLDFYMVNYLLASSTMVGLYSQASQYCELLLYIPESVRGIVLTKVSADSEYGNKNTAAAARQVVILMGLAGGCAFILARPLMVAMFGSAFAGAAAPLRWLLPGVIMLGVCNLIYVDLAGRGKPEFTTVSSAFGLALTVVFDLLLIPVLGINGAAMASSIAYSGSAILAMYYFSRLSGQRWCAPIALGRNDFRLAGGYVRRAIGKLAGIRNVA
jgi:O-antigen/teichoic acid export membrane protein